MPLTNVELRNLKPGSRAYKRADERGLYIEVRPGGSKLWRLKYRYAAKEKRLALGFILKSVSPRLVGSGTKRGEVVPPSWTGWRRS